MLTGMSRWGPVRSIPVGGLVAVGFLDERCVVVGSHDGLGVFEANSGARLDRVSDREGDYVWFQEAPPLAVYIDADGEDRIPVAGLWGGELRDRSDDGWTCERVSSGARLVGPEGTTITVVDDVEPRACGFSPEGHVFVYATSPTLNLTVRQAVRRRSQEEHRATSGRCGCVVA